MHTQKARNESPDVLKKLSPHATRLVKLEALEPGSSSSPISANNRTPKDKSPKVPDRKSPLSPVSEKKKPSRITELEELVLQEGLKKAQGTVSKTSKKQANQESEESRKQLQEVSMEEADKSRQRAVRVTEQLDATQASNSAMETELDKLKARLVAKETELQFISDETDNVYLLLKNQKETDAEAEAELKQQREVIKKLKADLMDKETQLQIVSDKNETLKSEMGTELRELQVQSNQLREAAEKANAMLSAGNNNNQRNPSYSEDIDDEVQRRKQGISLRRLVFGGRSRRNGWRLTE